MQKKKEKKRKTQVAQHSSILDLSPPPIAGKKVEGQEFFNRIGRVPARPDFVELLRELCNSRISLLRIEKMEVSSPLQLNELDGSDYRALFNANAKVCVLLVSFRGPRSRGRLWRFPSMTFDLFQTKHVLYEF